MIAIIGGGKMGEALLAGLLGTGYTPDAGDSGAVEHREHQGLPHLLG